jgi:predicted N-formylglutamate amidohydrolase
MSLLGPDDPPPFEEISGAAPVVLVCDHASNIVPRALSTLGLPRERLEEHIGWDIGAAAVTRLLAPMLDAAAVLCGYSRLVMDCNRDPTDPSSIPEKSDGVAIPGNRGLSPEARTARREDIFAPYHAAIEARLDRIRETGHMPAVISIHSFTPVMKGFARPWHVGILWDDDPRLAVPLMRALGEEPGLVVGDNQPYSARDPVGYTVEHHAQIKGLAHVAIELRQDLIAADAGAREWAERLARSLSPILARPEIYRTERHG